MEIFLCWQNQWANSSDRQPFRLTNHWLETVQGFTTSNGTLQSKGEEKESGIKDLKINQADNVVSVLGFSGQGQVSREKHLSLWKNNLKFSSFLSLQEEGDNIQGTVSHVVYSDQHSVKKNTRVRANPNGGPHLLYFDWLRPWYSFLSVCWWGKK